MSTWSNPEEQKIAYANYGREALESVGGVQKSVANHYRNFIDIEPNRSVRPGFTANDYYAFRPDEQVSKKYKTAIKMCMDAYDKVGIIRKRVQFLLAASRLLTASPRSSQFCRKPHSNI